MSISQMIVIAVIILIVVPPEKLPEVMRTIGSFLNDIRRQTAGVWDDIKKDAAFKPDEIFKPADFTVKSLLEVKKPEVSSSETPPPTTVETKVDKDDRTKQ
jgi:Sec-independent protein translocase protein TatA